MSDYLLSALKLCVEALGQDHPGSDSYWAAEKAGQDALDYFATAREDATESYEALVREAREVLHRLFRFAPDVGVDEFHDALREAHLLVAKIDGAE